jgi:hypothetical protein
VKPSEVLKASARELVEEVMRLQFENASLKDALVKAIVMRNLWGLSVLIFGCVVVWRVFGGGM